MRFKNFLFSVAVSFVILLAVLLVRAFAQEPTGKEPWCMSARDRGCWVDLNLKARAAMEEKISPCFEIEKLGPFAQCLNAAGYRGPLFEDERFKPRNVFRK